MSLFPVMLRGEAVRALVVGGGAVAARKAVALLDAGAAVRVVAPRVGERLRAGHERLTIDERRFEAADLADATLVVAASDDASVNA